MPFHFEDSSAPDITSVSSLPDAASLPLPSGAGEALPIQGGDFTLGVSPITPGLPNPFLTAADAALPEQKFLGLTLNQWQWIDRLAAGVQDATQILQGRRGTAVDALRTERRLAASEAFAQRREERAQRTEERTTKVEEERLGLERGRFGLEQVREARAIRHQELTEGRIFLTDASNLASRLITIPDQGQRAKAMNAMVQEARVRGGERIATIVHGILQQPDVGRMIGPLMRYLPESMAPALMQEGALLFHAGKGTEAVAKAEVLSIPQATNDLFARMQVVKNAVGDQYTDRPIPLSILEAAVEAANPGDPKGTNPELNLLRGLGEVFSKVQPRIKEALGDAGFEVPGVKAKVAETRAVVRATKQAEQEMALPDLSQDLRDILQREGMAKDARHPTATEITKASELQRTEAIDDAVSKAKKTATGLADIGRDLPLSREDLEAFRLPQGTTRRQAEGIVPQSPAFRERHATFEAALAIVNDIEKYSKKVNTATGFLSRNWQIVANEWGARMQTDDNAVLLESKRGTLSMVIRALGEKGTLAEGDVQRGLALIPNLWDKRSVAEAKIADLRNLFKTIAPEKTPGKGQPAGTQDIRSLSNEELLRRLRGSP